MTDKNIGQQEFFMQINNPNGFRRNILEASKLTLSILKETHRIRRIREAKHELIHRITHEIKELKLLVKKIEDLMPVYTKADLKKKFPHMVPDKKTHISMSVKEKKSEHKQPANKHVAEIDKVSRALDEVQRRLQGL
ncbi:MAG: hypothetical protein KKF46_07045 [Nanoarchaeota archaeon]|nr:hypothetical protein [Nanoarchaeota archaeon]MBU1322085.1 hypothetical protein [Nanoarchaeota archaeon]MBU1598191.1 hypothetical protein [Nanoarchaeota archaeon]MBU2441321.1 hypothetical protein [Nanoarchaeota archaeon]